MHESLGHGITCIETGYLRPGLAACYLVQDAGEVAIIETGTARAVPRILSALASAGLEREAVRYIIPTHVHLDHAGGAGALLAHCPNAVILAHPRGARHLAEPARLIAGTVAVYGEARFAALYGEVVAAPAARVVVAADGSRWSLGKRQFLVRDTPGHARHHFCLWDETSRGWFTGDTFGLAYRDLHTTAGPFLLPTTTPVQFEPEALLASVATLMDAEPACIYLTHHGRITARPALAQALCEQIEAYVAMALALEDGADAEARLAAVLADYTLARLRAAGCGWRETALRRFLALDMDLNASGLLTWRHARA